MRHEHVLTFEVALNLLVVEAVFLSGPAQGGGARSAPDGHIDRGRGEGERGAPPRRALPEDDVDGDVAAHPMADHGEPCRAGGGLVHDDRTEGADAIVAAGIAAASRTTPWRGPPVSVRATCPVAPARCATSTSSGVTTAPEVVASVAPLTPTTTAPT